MLTIVKKKLKSYINLERIPPHFPKIDSDKGDEPNAKFASDCWDQGYSDGKCGQPPIDALNAIKKGGVIYLMKAKENYENFKKQYIKFDEVTHEFRLLTSCIIGCIFLVIGLLMAFGEVYLTMNIVECAFNPTGEEPGYLLLVFAISIAFISVAFKFIWDKIRND